MPNKLSKLTNDAKKLNADCARMHTKFFQLTYKIRLGHDDWKKAHKLYEKAGDNAKKEKYKKIMMDLYKKDRKLRAERDRTVKIFRTYHNRYANCYKLLSDVLTDRQINTKWKRASTTKEALKIGNELGKLLSKYDRFNQDLMKGF